MPPPRQAPSLHPARETRNLRDLRDRVPRKHRRGRGASKPHSTGWCTQVPPEAWVGMGTSGLERSIWGHAGPTGTRVSRQSPVPAGKTPVYGPSQATTAEGRAKRTNTRDPHGAGTGRGGPSTRQHAAARAPGPAPETEHSGPGGARGRGQQQPAPGPVPGGPSREPSPQKSYPQVTDSEGAWPGLSVLGRLPAWGPEPGVSLHPGSRVCGPCGPWESSATGSLLASGPTRRAVHFQNQKPMRVEGKQGLRPSPAPAQP